MGYIRQRVITELVYLARPGVRFDYGCNSVKFSDQSTGGKIRDNVKIVEPMRQASGINVLQIDP